MSFDIIIWHRTANTRSPTWNERNHTFLLKAL